MADNNNTTTTTPVVVEDGNVVDTQPVANGNSVVVDTPTGGTPNGGNNTQVDNNNDKGYVQYRVERAKEQATNSILKELGVENLDEAKKRMADGSNALKEVLELKAKLEAQDKAKETAVKRNLLADILDKEKVFDTDALINYLDLDKVELENGQVKDADGIVASLKKAKPNFFGKFETVTDGYVKGQVTKPTTALEKQQSGNVVGAIDDYLKNIFK